MEKRIVITEDGSATIYLPELDEHYHSLFGAIEESYKVYIEPGLSGLNKRRIEILEIGFGTGLNALIAAIESISSNLNIYYTTLEKHPLEFKTINNLNYGEILGGNADKLFTSIHKSDWEVESQITKNFNLTKIESDLLTYTTSQLFDIIFFDAFAPSKQPEMWSNDIISKVCSWCKDGGLFLTYSASGQLKRQLITAGFKVDRIPGPTGKRVITRAIKL